MAADTKTAASRRKTCARENRDVMIISSADNRRPLSA